jgi:hypothetical protein
MADRRDRYRRRRHRAQRFGDADSEIALELGSEILKRRPIKIVRNHDAGREESPVN